MVNTSGYLAVAYRSFDAGIPLMSTVIPSATIKSTLLHQVLIFTNFQVIVHDNKTQLASLMSLARKRVFKVWESALSVSAHETTPTCIGTKGSCSQ